MFKIKVYGAGSIGNHLTHASRQMGWQVMVCDTSQAALDRMKNEIYPSRYGAWDSSIQQFLNQDAPQGGFDLIFIGTPPEYHIPLALEALDENPKGLLIEKPLCGPYLEGAQELWTKAKNSSTLTFVGYTHVVGKSMQKVEEILRSGVLGEIKTIDVEFREHWEGIFKAHPWLSGPEDSYLGYWMRGGGASGEHSHAVNLWQHLVHVLNLGRVSEVTASLSYVRKGRAEYDDLCFIHLKTETGFMGRVVQDVVTRPPKKQARIQGTNGTLLWEANYNSDGDMLKLLRPGQAEELFPFPKKRPDDFIDECRHLEACIKQKNTQSSISLERGLDSMMVLSAAHESQKKGTTMKVGTLSQKVEFLAPIGKN